MSPREIVEIHSARELRCRLGDTILPGGDRTWLDLAVDAARDGGVTVDDVLGHARLASVKRARHDYWSRLRSFRYSYPEIAARVGVHHTTVLHALKKLRARGDARPDPAFGFAGMGVGAGI